jgi:hypothetical protein
MHASPKGAGGWSAGLGDGCVTGDGAGDADGAGEGRGGGEAYVGIGDPTSEVTALPAGPPQATNKAAAAAIAAIAASGLTCRSFRVLIMTAPLPRDALMGIIDDAPLEHEVP